MYILAGTSILRHSQAKRGAVPRAFLVDGCIELRHLPCEEAIVLLLCLLLEAAPAWPPHAKRFGRLGNLHCASTISPCTVYEHSENKGVERSLHRTRTPPGIFDIRNHPLGERSCNSSALVSTSTSRRPSRPLCPSAQPAVAEPRAFVSALPDASGFAAEPALYRLQFCYVKPAMLHGDVAIRQLPVCRSVRPLPNPSLAQCRSKTAVSRLAGRVTTPSPSPASGLVNHPL
mmetsp:Transcript_42250/g.99211  ORF Transcript_42250/g.99211 Transcript_42250/m.99211 type:complete len:231 (+) Transcript_42250:23-715(+)